MAVRRIVRGKKASLKSVAKAATNVSLADEPIEPLVDIGDYTLWLFGEAGVGKTSLAAQFPDAHLFMWEPGAKSLLTRWRQVKEWPEWVGYLDLLENDESVRTIVVDVLEMAYKMCFDYMCKHVMHIDHPNDENDRGKSWSRISDEFMKQMRRAMGMPGKGCVFISHAASREIKRFDGEKYDRICPNLSNSPLNMMEGAVDIMAYMYSDRNGRRLQVRPDDLVMAKCRPTDAFKWEDGSPMPSFYLGRDAEEAYQNLTAAFANQLEKPVEAAKPKKVLKRRSVHRG